LSPDRRRLAERTLAFNEALAREAKKHGVELVDIYTASREEVPRRPELLWKDGYHPSDLGYARWAELLWTGIERRIAAR
jgi:lysophospholipase L1-like esterase